MREGAADAALTRLIANYWQQRNDRYSQLRQAATEASITGSSDANKIEMSYIGG